MCTGLEPAAIAAIAGTALSAVGTGMQAISSKRQQERQVDANNAVVQQFMQKNENLAEESRGAFDQRMAKEKATPEEAAKPKADARAQAASDLIDTSKVVAPLRGSAPSVVREAAQAETSRVDEQGRQRAQSLANALSFGDMLFGKALDNREAANDIGMVGGFARSNADLVPQQAQLAQLSAAGKGGMLGTLGSGLGVLGSLGTSAAGAGVFDKAPKAGAAKPKFNLGL